MRFACILFFGVRDVRKGHDMQVVVQGQSQSLSACRLSYNESSGCRYALCFNNYFYTISQRYQTSSYLHSRLIAFLSIPQVFSSDVASPRLREELWRPLSGRRYFSLPLYLYCTLGVWSGSQSARCETLMGFLLRLGLRMCKRRTETLRFL